MDNKLIDKALSAPIPGGSNARDWFLPHDTERGLENVRDVVRRMFAAVAEDAEPVAWANAKSFNDHSFAVVRGKVWDDDVPLYARPQHSDVAPLVEALEKIENNWSGLGSGQIALNALAAWKAAQ